MAAITDFEVTYGSALAANKFHRIVNASGAGADINSGFSPVYLWYKNGEEAPIVDLSIIYDDEPVPAGFSKVAKDVTKGADSRVYLCYRRSSGEAETLLPIVDVKILATDATAEGFVRLDRAINRSSNLSVFIKRLDPTAAEATKSEGPKWTVNQLKVGDWFDCKDSYEQWQIAKVTALTGSGISVTYKGLSKYYDEVVPKTMSRAAELGTFTSGSIAYVAQGSILITALEEYQAMSLRVDQFLDGTMAEPEEREKFVKQDLPNLLETALSSRVTPTLADGLFVFIRKAIEFVIFQLKSPNPLDRKTVQMFERIMLADDNCNYFVCHFGAVRPGFPDAEGVDGKFMSLPDGGASKYYVGAVNHFGDLNGFELLIQRLDQRDPLIPLTEAASYTDVLWVCKYCSTKFMIEDVFPRFRRALFDRIKDMTDQELRDVDRNLFSTMMTKLEELLRTVMKRHKGATTENADQTMESMGLVIALRMLTCPFMSLRLKGLSDIKDMLERVQARDVRSVAPQRTYNVYGRGNVYGYSAVPVIKPTVWLTGDIFAAWLRDNQILEICLGERVNGKVFDLHMEALKRLPTIVTFLADNGALTLQHVQRFWKIATESGDTMKRGVFDILVATAKSLTEEQFDVIFSSISTLAVADIDAPVLTLITTLTKFALVAAEPVVEGKEAKSYGVDLLWRAVSEPGLQEDVVTLAEKSFIDMLTNRSDLVQKYTILCIQNISAGRSPVKSMNMASQLLRTLPVVAVRDPADFASQESAVNFLEAEMNVIQLILTDLQKYKAAASEAAAKLGFSIPSLDSTGGDAVVFLKPESHLVNIKTRLEFLGLLLTSGSAPLSGEVLGQLWTELVGANITPAEREVFFEWISNIISSAGAPTRGTTDIVDEVFARYLSQPAVMRNASVGPNAFAAFESAFKTLNVRAGKIRGANSIAVADVDLVGIDALWSLSVEATNADVFKSAAELLIALHMKLLPALQVNKGIIWERFVVRCMAFVQTSLGSIRAGEADPTVERRIEAALGLLQRFLHLVEDSGRKSKENYSVPWTVTFTYSDGDQVKTIFLPENPTVGQVRVEAGLKIGFPPERIRVQGKDRRQHYACEEWDDKPFEQTGMAPNAATCMPCVRPMPDTELFEEDRIYPKVDLSDPDRSRPRLLLCNTAEYFENLFEVLSLRKESVVSGAWSLIGLLPINDRILHDINAVKAAAAVDLNTLFNPSAPLKLLYVLQIVDKFASPPAKGTPEEKAAGKEWCEAFAARGGVSHLLTILSTCDVEAWTQSTLPQSCLTILAKILTTFLTPLRYDTGIPYLAGVSVPALGARLINLVAASVKSAATAVYKSANDDDGVFEIKDEGALALAQQKKGKKGGKGGKDAGTGTGFDEDDDLDLNKETTVEDDTPAEVEEDSAEILQSKLAASTKESLLVQHSLALFSILAYQEESIRSLPTDDQNAGIILAGLLKVKDVSLRSEIEKGLSQLAASIAIKGGSVAVRDALLKLLVANLDSTYAFDDTCTEFFSLLARLLRLKTDESPAGVDIASLLSRLSALVSAHPIVEVTVEQEDFLLRGLLATCASLLSAYPALKLSVGSLVREVFHDCLFAVPTASTPRDSPPPKCKHSTSRRIAFAFLEELARKCPPNLGFLCEEMVPHHVSPAVTVSKRGYSLPTLPKSSTGYVGLKNLGCICYMNATVQNFFMVPEFRCGVLEIEDGEEDKKESLLYQLQRMFAFLQETDKQCYNPKGFCYAFKDWEGNPTNTFIQKDASEFLGMLFQQMEMKLQGSPQEHILKSCFGGTFQNELIADGKYSAREEPFTFISIDIKNKKDLYSALRGFISGETVDYKWENADGSKVELPTQKRTSFKVLPQHLIVHLKRFEFDYETMQNSKLNDRFEFPRELDVYDFTADGRPDKVSPPKEGGEPSAEGGSSESKDEDAIEEAVDRSNYKYQLAGMVIHSGTAHAGHYYSFIRERLGNKLGNWMTFNDSSVTPFNPDYIEREAFGGVETFKYAYSNTTTSHAVTRSAFMLFYDRVPVEPAQGPSDAAPALLLERTPSGTGPTSPEELAATLLAKHRSKAAASLTRASVPSMIYEAITNDNIGFWRERNIYDKSYFSFLSALLQTELASLSPVDYPAAPITCLEDATAAGGPSFRILRLATLFVINTVATSAQKGKWAEWMTRLQSLFASNAVASIWLLQTVMSNPPLLKRVLFEVEEGPAAILATAFGVVAAAEQPFPDPRSVKPAAPSAAAIASAQPPGLKRALSGDIDASEMKASETAVVTAAPVAILFPAPHRLVAATFFETLISMLPVVATNWAKMSQFFVLLNLVVKSSPQVLEYAKARGLISVLVGFFLDGDSPLPQYNVAQAPEYAAASSNVVDYTDVSIGPLPATAYSSSSYQGLDDGIRVTGNTVGPASAAAKGAAAKGLKMGNAYAAVDFGSLLACLQQLVMTSLPPSGTPSGVQEAPGTPLSADDAEMLSSDVFLKKLLSGEQGINVDIARRLLAHVSWNNEPLAARIGEVIRAGVVAADGEAVVPWFKALAELLSIADDLQARRFEQLVTSITTAMQSQAIYYKATEASIIQFLNLAKHSEVLRVYIHANKQKLRWMYDWLRANPRAPTYYAVGPVKLNKPHAPYVYATGNAGYDALAVRSPAVADRCLALLDGRSAVFTDFDSLDDQLAVIGKRIAVMYPSTRWYLGRVLSYDPLTGSHTVEFDDKEKKVYNLQKTTYKFVKESTVASAWYPPAATDELPFTVTVEGVAEEGEDASEDGDAAEDPNAEQPGLDQEVQGGNNNQGFNNYVNPNLGPNYPEDTDSDQMDDDE